VPERLWDDFMHCNAVQRRWPTIQMLLAVQSCKMIQTDPGLQNYLRTLQMKSMQSQRHTLGGILRVYELAHAPFQICDGIESFSSIWDARFLKH
jgi:hypothetical protein